MMNSFLNTKTNVKKLQYGVKKCQKMHVGCQKSTCPDLYVDKWTLKKADKDLINIRNLEDTEDGTHCMNKSDSNKYLGDYISSTRGNKDNIAARRGKGVSVVRQIANMMEDMCLGPYTFEVMVILRNSLLINGMLANSAAWYGLTKSDMEQLEQVG